MSKMFKMAYNPRVVEFTVAFDIDDYVYRWKQATIYIIAQKSFDNIKNKPILNVRWLSWTE